MPIIQPQIKSLELLAPAGDWESLLAGISAGADAFYIGGKAFNARQNAVNFSLKQLQEATDLIHLHGKKIYITVNTLIAESELLEVLDYLKQLYNIGVDAVIVQDLGLIQLARQYLPDLELHASTQMTVHNREGAIYLKKLGLKRVVLARELVRAEVEAIALLAGIEVEVFVHGASCICYSGQCLMSSMIGGRSGNRGRCAQPCRMEYQLVHGKNDLIATAGSYLLSPKDLALITLIPDLYRAGVKSLKIEGRMKRPEYVYNVVKVYSRALERYCQNPTDFTVEPEEMRELEETFNRGFSIGYFGGNRNAELMSFTRPNNRGVFLGRIKRIDIPGERITVKLESNLEVGDEVEVWVSQGGRSASPIRSMTVNGQNVNEAKAGEIVSFDIAGKLYSGDRVFKIFSIRSDRELKQALDPENPGFKVSCTVKVSGEIGQVLTITYYDRAGYQGTAITDNVLQEAKNRPLTREILREQLGRLGNTPYHLTELELTIPDMVMIPLSDLNQARRKAIEELTMARIAKYRKNPIQLDSNALFTSHQSEKSPTRSNYLSVWVADLEGVSAAVDAGADIIYAGGDELTGFHWTEKALKTAIENAHEKGAHLVIGLPRIQREGQREHWLPFLQISYRLKPDGIMISDLGSLHLVQQETEQVLFLNYTLNFFNSYSLKCFQNHQVKQITLSPELTWGQVKEIRLHLAGIRMECLVQGPLELMVSEYCPLHSVLKKSLECDQPCRREHYYLRDRLDLDFPIYTDQFCRMHLLNAKDLCLYGDLVRLSENCNLTFRLELKTYPADKIRQIVKKYRMALDGIFAGKELSDEKLVIEEFKTLTGCGITKGHYFRGVE